MPCGRWWDAVQLAAFDAVLVINLMQHRSGPAIEDQNEDTVTWLVPVRTTDGWRIPSVTVLGRGQQIHVPPPRWATSRRWLIEPPVVGDCLTSPELLRTALATVLGSPRRGDGEVRGA
ncbi:hypothetical protein [Streptomyces sp. B6B3]|uniref:hypothetical protein n=1 Tax=Streptomyces sp. B6B3 TaxID=3153570 RepID=UPI00325F945D